MLSKDQSVFDAMFNGLKDVPNVLSANGLVEGTSDDYPIRLQGDSVEEFSALLWSLYALHVYPFLPRPCANYHSRPAEIALAMNTRARVPRLVHLARIAHKYQFKSTESWALEILTAFHASAASTISLQSLVQVTELAVLCECSGLLDVATVKWKRLIGEGRALSTTILMAERLNLRDLLGLSYHSMMLKGRQVWDLDPHLTRSQRIRLLSGYYALSQACTELPSNPPKLSHSTSCPRPKECDKAWGACWSLISSNQHGGIADQVVRLHTADLEGRVTVAESIIQAFAQRKMSSGKGIVDGIHEKCLKFALKATQVKVKEVREELVDWYSDVS